MAVGRFLLLLLLALVLARLPLIGLPLDWAETFFHELSHGLVALFTGGQVESLRLHLDGSGLCTFRGGWPFAAAFAGYAGAPLWGLAIFRLAGGGRILAGALAVGVLLVMLFWVRDPITLLIAGVLLTLFALPLRWRPGDWLRSACEVLGLAVILNALRAPTALFGNGIGDAAELARMSWIPASVWIVLWLAIALGCLWSAWRHARTLPAVR